MNSNDYPFGLPGSGATPWPNQLPHPAPHWPHSQFPGPAAMLPIPAAPIALPVQVQALLARSLGDCRSERNRSSTNPAMTHAALLLDESSSMGRHRGAAVEGYNTQVNVVREGAREAGETRVTLTTFSSSARRVLAASPVEQLQPLADNQYQPYGGTALYDALGETIAFLLTQPGADDPNTAFLVAAFTDGEENSSRTYSGSLLKDLISRLEATGRWTFTLMGPQGGADEMAKVLNIPTGNVAAFDPSRAESVQSAFGQMACASTNYMSLRSVGETSSVSLYAGNGDTT